MKKIRKLLFMLLIGLVCATFIPNVVSRADFGSYSGDSDYGGSSGGGSFSGGSSWGGSSSYSSSRSRSRSGSGGGGFGFGSIIAIFVIAGVYYIVASSKSSNKHSNKPAGAALTPSERLKSVEEYKKLDELFDENEFCQKLSNIYVQMQNGWTAKNIEAVKPYFTDAFWQQADRQLEAFRKNGTTNHIDKISVLGVNVRGFYQHGGNDHMIALLRTRITDYTINDATGKTVSGSMTKEKFMTYEWDLIRASGIKTSKEEGIRAINCPRCGAPININQTARCPYCSSIIQVEAYDWALTAIKGISQVTK